MAWLIGIGMLQLVVLVYIAVRVAYIPTKRELRDVMDDALSWDRQLR